MCLGGEKMEDFINTLPCKRAVCLGREKIGDFMNALPYRTRCVFRLREDGRFYEHFPL